MPQSDPDARHLAARAYSGGLRGRHRTMHPPAVEGHRGGHALPSACCGAPMPGGYPRLAASLRDTRPRARTLCAVSLARPRHPGVVRHHKSEGVANPHTPELLARHSEDEYLAGVRRDLHPARRRVE